MVTTDDGHQTFQYNHTSSSRTSVGDDGGTYGYHPLIGEASVHTAFSSSSAGAGGAPPAKRADYGPGGSRGQAEFAAQAQIGPGRVQERRAR